MEPLRPVLLALRTSVWCLLGLSGQFQKGHSRKPTPYRHQSFHRSAPRPCDNADRQIGSKRKLQARQGKRDGRKWDMGSPTSVTTENPEPQRQGGAGSRGTQTAATDDVVGAAYSDERPSEGRWLSEAQPTGV